MKRIVIFADGTWNSPEDDYQTNVLAMARAIKPVAKAGDTKTSQVVFYDWGVGTDRKKLTGGLSGAGIDKNIQDCYRFLVHNYDPGDQIFLFGFSRGAYTVRSLAGFVRNCGLLKRKDANLIDEAYALYRGRRTDSHPDEPKAVAFRREHAVALKTKIEFVGVWDTVGSLGIPLPFWGTLGESNALFHDTSPSGIIQHIRHAVSIDENREDFQVTPVTPKAGVDLQEVFFPGIHSDVGGSYEIHGLSDAACDWMMREAKKFGLVFEQHLSSWLKPDPEAKLHNERKGKYLLRGEITREITGPVHQSAKDRWDKDVENYQKKSKALQNLLDSVDGDWDRIEIVP